MDILLENGSLQQLAEHSEFSIDERMEIDDHLGLEYHNCINYDNTSLMKLAENYTKNLQRALELKECLSCHRLINKAKLVAVDKIDIKHQAIIKQLISNNRVDEEEFICKDYCISDLKIGRVPTYSPLNNMELELLPECITQLNFYERLLIQRAKCFQTIVQLRPTKKTYGTNACQALRGLAIHLPLSYEKTHQHIQNTLPNADTMNIIVEGLPTKTNNIWRALIDIKKVFEALYWLKKITSFTRMS